MSSTTDRNTAPRTGKYDDDPDMDLVLKEFQDQHPVAIGLPVGDFPKNIKRRIWSAMQETASGAAATLLCELVDGTFVLYTAIGCFCCYRGFGDRATVELTGATSASTLIYLMDESMYAAYIDTTVASDVEGYPLNPEELYRQIPECPAATGMHLTFVQASTAKS